MKYLKFFEGRLLIFFELHFDDLSLETVRAQLQEVSSFQKQGTPCRATCTQKNRTRSSDVEQVIGIPGVSLNLSCGCIWSWQVGFVMSNWVNEFIPP